MCDFDDDFEEFVEDGFMEEDQLDDEIMDDPDDLEDDCDAGSFEDDQGCDEFTAKDAFIVGGAMGWAYEEGLQDAVQLRQTRKVRKRTP